MSGCHEKLFPKTVLIVEDDPPVRELMSRRLASRGIEILAAPEGREGLRLFRERRPDLILLDLMMPGMPGTEFLEELRKSPAGSIVPVIIVTARTEDRCIVEAFELGADDYITKPFQLRDLELRVVSRFLRSRVCREVNPLTGLPGNSSIKEEIRRRIESGAPFGVAYLDLDNFKGYNDRYGFDAGDRMILLVRDILEGVDRDTSPREFFYGHVGGDDFVVLGDAESFAIVLEEIRNRFDDRVLGLYEDEDRREGGIEVVNRSGEWVFQPIVSISIAALDSRRRQVADLRELSEVAAELKKAAKRIPGSVVFFERRSGRRSDRHGAGEATRVFRSSEEG
ncbi:MAG: response regulator [Planctomycetes bacterium]|nr:response regulator [Planctomycetota bacterium]